MDVFLTNFKGTTIGCWKYAKKWTFEVSYRLLGQTSHGSETSPVKEEPTLSKKYALRIKGSFQVKWRATKNIELLTSADRVQIQSQRA